MTTRRLISFISLAIAALVLIGLPTRSQLMRTHQASNGLVAGRNVNMISGKQLPGGDPFLQRQNEPSIAVSSRNRLHLLAGANDYRTVDMLIPYEEIPGFETAVAARDAWLGLYKSYDGGQSWTSTLLPGFPLDYTNAGSGSPLKAYSAAADPTVRAGTSGMFYYSGLAFNRNQKENSVFIARLIDNNNAEGKTVDPIKYIDAKVIDTGTLGQFIDKPLCAVDIPRAGAKTVPIQATAVPLQNIPAGNVYLAYSIFTGQDPLNPGSKVMIARSLDCGTSWEKSQKLSESNHVNQGVMIAVSPPTGNVYVAWRRFARYADPHVIMFSYSKNGGKTFSPAVAVTPSIQPFDQGTTATSFRTNSYPALIVDQNGTVYLAWAQRGVGPGGDARIVVITSANDGASWSSPQPIDNHAGRGHQFMPVLSYAGGRITAVWYDQRYDVSGHWDTYISDEPGQPIRHTTDVRAAQADVSAGTGFGGSVQISRYRHLTDADGINHQVQFNPPNYPMFKEGTRPFHGDFLDLAAAPTFLPGPGGWSYNTDATVPPVFHAAWTDNRNVKPPANGDWGNYAPPGSTQDPAFQSSTNCEAGQTSMRNQDVYTASIAQGLVVGCPGNSKPLGPSGNKHTFVVFVKNMTQWQKRFRLTIDAPGNVTASFLQFAALSSLEVEIFPFSSISRTVFVTSSQRHASFHVDVEEISGPGGNPVIGGLNGNVILNPDIENPEIENPEIENNELHNPDIENPEIENPEIENVFVINPDIENPEIENTDVINPDIENPEIENPEIENPEIENPSWANPDIENPDIENPEIENGAISDYTWKVTNAGNTNSAYTFKMISAHIDESQYAQFGFQLLIYRVHTSPAATSEPNACTLTLKHQDELLANIIKPVIFNPDIENPEIENPEIENSSLGNSTFWLAPGDQAYITLRVYDPNKNDPITFNPGAVQGVSIGQAVNSANENDAVPTPPVSSSEFNLMIYHASLPYGSPGVPYSVYLVALGGTPHYTWSIPAGALPGGLSLNPATGGITGTPAAAGTYAFTVQVTDKTGQSVSQPLNLHILEPLKITTSSPLPDGIKNSAYSESLGAAGGLPPYAWSFTSGKPDWLTLSAGGALSGTPGSAGTITFTVQVIDSCANPQSATKSFSLFIAPLPLSIIAGPLADGFVDASYGQTLGAINGEGPLRWSVLNGTLPPGLTMSSDGTISGRPVYDDKVGYPVAYSFTAQVVDSFSTPRIATQDFSIRILAKKENWLDVYASPGDDEAWAAAVDSSGNFCATGSIRGGATGADFYTVKYDGTGQKLWQAIYDGPFHGDDEARAMTFDSSGNAYVTGYSTGSSTGADFFTIKYNSAGTLLWGARCDGPAQLGDYATAIAVDASGNVYVTGYSYRGSVLKHADYLTVKYDSAGNLVWKESYDDRRNGMDEATAIAVDISGNIYVTGISQESQPSGTGLQYDFYTLKYNKNGKLLWGVRYDGPANGDDEAAAMALDASGVYVTGRSKGTGSLFDYYTVKYDLAGGTLWQARYSGPADDEARAVAVDASGNVYVTGGSVNGSSGADYYTIKYDPAGGKLWDARYDGPSHKDDKATAVALDASGLYVTGWSTGAATGNDVYTVKYNMTTGKVLWESRYDGPAHGQDGGNALVVAGSGYIYVAGYRTDAATLKDFLILRY